jgi:hypothetical protein
MDEFVTHTRHECPGDLGVTAAELGRESLDRCADHHELVQSGRLGFEVFEKGGFVQTPFEFEDQTGRPGNV